MTPYDRLVREYTRREKERRRIIQRINHPDRRKGERRGMKKSTHDKVTLVLFTLLCVITLIAVGVRVGLGY